jgi:hypothetical protein
LISPCFWLAKDVSPEWSDWSKREFCREIKTSIKEVNFRGQPMLKGSRGDQSNEETDECRYVGLMRMARDSK